ncbi:MAG: GGDEF domain-containing protein [Gemmatimonadetes bacterium]|nr:GGDEF domain-containing protein [Gemmatimonadota bacterium]
MMQGPDKQRLKQRGILLASAGLSLGLVVILALKLLGLSAVTFGEWVIAAASTLVVLLALWLVPRLGWDARLRWDPHYVYVPVLAAASILDLYTLVAPEARFLALMAWFVALLFLAGLVGFLGVVLTSAFMLSGYLGALWAHAGRAGVSLPLELTTAVVVLLITCYVGVVFERLRRDRREMKALRQTLAELAVTDPLTGLPNRRYFEGFLQAELARLGRYGGTCAVCMIDVDNFKAYNDALGHLAGDATLRDLAAVMREKLRVSDVLARYGGDEFALIMVNTPRDEAYQALDRLREAVERGDFEREDVLPGGVLTISAGVASAPEHGLEYEDLVRKADEALYAAKRHGRNQLQAHALT